MILQKRVNFVATSLSKIAARKIWIFKIVVDLYQLTSLASDVQVNETSDVVQYISLLNVVESKTWKKKYKF